MSRANDSINQAAEHFINEGQAQERHHAAGVEIALATAKQAAITLEAAKAMGAAGEQLRVAAARIADLDQLMRLQQRQIGKLLDDVATLKALNEKK